VSQLFGIETRERTPSVKTQKAVKLMALMCLALLAIAFAINSVSSAKPLLQIAVAGRPISMQLLIGGLVGGLLSALTFAAVLFVPTFSGFTRHLIDILETVLDVNSLSPVSASCVSLCAGIGEETLFRGALQPMIGIWWASLLFAILHINPSRLMSDPRSTAAFATSVFVVSLLFGQIFTSIGLVAAIAAHFAWDFVAVLSLKQASRAARMGV
jgi:membrane protease YdiL (CAAX protease family)